MKTFTLSNDEPEIEFKLNSAESYLLIKNVKFISAQNLNNQWANFISKIKLSAELGYIIQIDKESGIMDERKLQFSILLFPDLHSTEPIIHLNQMIRNETFTTGRASELKFYRTLKIKLQSSHEFNEICSLQFEFEGCKIDE